MVAIELGARLRYLAWAAFAVVALLLLPPRAAWAAADDPGVPVPPNQLITDTGEGEVSAADRDFATKVRLAGLWEMPAGQMAQEKSKDPRVQAIGKEIAAQHTILDQMVRAAAKKLDIDLPSKPNADQQGWLGEMRAAAPGKEFDQIFVDRLRAAHGKIFPAIATIRASTRNDTIRKLAQRTNQFVATHLTLLESSNLVDFDGLPTAPPPTTAPAKDTAAVLSANQTATTNQPSSPLTTPVVAIVVVAAFGVAFLITRKMWPSKPRRRRYYN